MGPWIHVLPDTHDAGAENQALYLLRELTGRGGPALGMVYFRAGRAHEHFERLGVSMHCLEPRRRLTLDVSRRARALRALYEREPPALLHTWMFEANITGLLAARRWPETRVVVTQRSGTIQRTLPGQMRAMRAVRGRIDHAIANSEEGRNVLLDIGLDPSRITVVPNAIPEERVRVGQTGAEVRAELGIRADEPVVAFVGRFDDTKDFPTLLAAMAVVWRSRPAATLLLVGPSEKDLETLGESVSDRAIALGWRPRPADLMNAADVLVLSSWTEGHSNAVDEALMLGLPVATTDTGAHASLVGEAGGRVVPIRSPDLLGRAILGLLESPPSREEVRAIARQRLDVVRVTDMTLAVYEHVLS